MTTSKTQKNTINQPQKHRNLAQARLYVKSTFNNTIVTICDHKGDVLTWSSAGHAGFKGSRKSTPFAATTAIEKALNLAKDFGIKRLSVYLQGPGLGRDAALRYLRAKRDFDIDMISDITPIPHNGPKPPKQRKV